MSTFRVAEKMQVMTMATIGAEQISQKLCKAHLESFNLTRAVVFVGSTAVVTRVKESQAHQARGVLRLFVSTLELEKFSNWPLDGYKRQKPSKVSPRYGTC